MARIIAERDRDIFVVTAGANQGRVIDLTEGIAYQKFDLQSIFSRGYWETPGQIDKDKKLRVMELHDIAEEAGDPDEAQRRTEITPPESEADARILYQVIEGRVFTLARRGGKLDHGEVSMTEFSAISGGDTTPGWYDADGGFLGEDLPSSL